MKRIIISVSNDIVTDQRVNKVAGTLLEAGVEIIIVGRRLKDSLPGEGLPYKMKRFRLLFNKGPMFYAALNIRLFFYLLFTRADYLLANDLDTLLPNFLVSKLKRKPLVYDTHEYFIELPELVNRKFVKKIWGRIEKMILPRLKNIYTVNKSIADIYSKKYNIQVSVVRNVHQRYIPSGNCIMPSIAEGKKIVIYTGALNVGRGIELMIEVLKYLDNIVFLIAGYGYMQEKLESLAANSKVKDRICFLGRLSPVQLIEYSALSNIGVSLEENLGLNHYYALPNKLFTYIQARLPVLVRDFPEIAKIVNGYNIGIITLSDNAQEIAQIINVMLDDQQKYQLWKENLEKAANELCWENECQMLKNVFKKTGLDF